MKTNGFFVTSMLAVAFLAGCTNTEEPVTANSEEAIRITAGIGELTRAVIDAGYGADLNVSFARIDNQPAGMNWNTPSIDAIRTGGAGNTAKWTAVTSITVKNVTTELKLSLDKTTGAGLTATGATDKSLPVKSCPATVSVVGQATPRTGYLMLYPVVDMGTVAAAIDLEVKATYGGEVKTLPVSIMNIDGGVQAGQSHLITLTFAEDGTIIAEAGIAVWQPGNDGSSIITPGE